MSLDKAINPARNTANLTANQSGLTRLVEITEVVLIVKAIATIQQMCEK